LFIVLSLWLSDRKLASNYTVVEVAHSLWTSSVDSVKCQQIHWYTLHSNTTIWLILFSIRSLLIDKLKLK